MESKHKQYKSNKTSSTKNKLAEIDKHKLTIATKMKIQLKTNEQKKMTNNRNTIEDPTQKNEQTKMIERNIYKCVNHLTMRNTHHIIWTKKNTD